MCLGCWKSKPIGKFEISRRTGKPKSLCWTCKGRKVKHPKTVYYDQQLLKPEGERNKICNTCFNEKSVSQFSPRRVNKKMAYRSECKSCEKNYRRTEGYRSDARARRAADPEARAKAREYLRANKDKINNQRRLNRQINGPSPREPYWRHNRRARSKFVKSDLPHNFMEIALNHYGPRCQKCSSDKDLHFDHIVPLAWGLVSSNTWDNCQLLCKVCNLEKSYHVTIDYRDMSIPIYNSDEEDFSGVDVLKILGDEKYARLQWLPKSL